MPGTFIVKASQSPFIAGQSRAARLDALPEVLASTSGLGAFDQRFVATWGDTGIPAANMRYRILASDGSVLDEGTTNDQGETAIKRHHLPDGVRIEILER